MSFETLQPNANEEREYIRHAIKSFDLFRDETFRNMWVNFDRGIVGTYAMPKQNGQMYELLELKFYKAKGWDTQKVSEFLTDNPQYAQTFTMPVSAIAEGIIKRKRMKEEAKGEEIADMLKRIKSRMIRERG